MCEWIHILSLWLKTHLLPFGPLFTPIVASVGGGIALYSIHVTRSVARRRAAVDFFLKTDMDKGMVEAYSAFITALAAWASYDATGKPIEKFARGEDGSLSTEYKDILNYLNIHELVAVGVKNKVFDEDVCFNFWSIALVRHTDGTRKLIDYQRTLEGFESSYWELRTLSSKWKKRTAKWQKKQQAKTKWKGPPPESVRSAPAPVRNPEKTSPQTIGENQRSPKEPDAPHQ
jgi:hypothetical protein